MLAFHTSRQSAADVHTRSVSHHHSQLPSGAFCDAVTKHSCLSIPFFPTYNNVVAPLLTQATKTSPEESVGRLEQDDNSLLQQLRDRPAGPTVELVQTLEARLALAEAKLALFQSWCNELEPRLEGGDMSISSLYDGQKTVPNHRRIPAVCALVPWILEKVDAQDLKRVMLLVGDLVQNRARWDEANRYVYGRCRNDKKGDPELYRLLNDLCSMYPGLPAGGLSAKGNKITMVAAVTAIAVLLAKQNQHA